jgi:hypothetical protein
MRSRTRHWTHSSERVRELRRKFVAWLTRRTGSEKEIKSPLNDIEVEARREIQRTEKIRQRAEDLGIAVDWRRE